MERLQIKQWFQYKIILIWIAKMLPKIQTIQLIAKALNNNNLIKIIKAVIYQLVTALRIAKSILHLQI